MHGTFPVVVAERRDRRDRGREGRVEGKESGPCQYLGIDPGRLLMAAREKGADGGEEE